jgi:hypothetical protein
VLLRVQELLESSQAGASRDRKSKSQIATLEAKLDSVNFPSLARIASYDRRASSLTSQYPDEGASRVSGAKRLRFFFLSSYRRKRNNNSTSLPERRPPAPHSVQASRSIQASRPPSSS